MTNDKLARLHARVTEAEYIADGVDAERLIHIETEDKLAAAKARVAELEATLDDVGRGSTHELVRYWLEKTIAAEGAAKTARAEIERLAQCWHCGTALAPEPRPCCERCPWECDDEDCPEPGCELERRNEVEP